MVPRQRLASRAAIGALAVLLAGCPTTAAPSGSARVSEAPSPSVGSSVPAVPTSPASIDASPASTPTPDPALLHLTATGCPGGAVLEWTPSTHRNFHHYTGLRSPEAEISTDYPPIAPAVDWGETYATDPFVTSAVDASILPSDRTWNYRMMAYDILGDVVSASQVASARIFEVRDLGQPVVETDQGITHIEWHRFSGEAECFTSYRVLFGAGRPPSILLTEVSHPDRTSIETDALHSGTTYQLRVDAVRVTTLGSFVSGRSETVFYTVP
jgi:hypothetical protein